MTVWSVPGKTFLVGEYLALEGGPSLLLSTSPRFVLQTAPAGHRAFANPASPAGRYLAKHANDFAEIGFDFRDPHRGQGGLGASSAQFALLYAVRHHLASLVPDSFDWQSLLSEYRDCAWNGEGRPPSGADVVAQLSGGITWFNGNTHQARRLKWNFANLGFTLLRTGTKLATHEHLKRSPEIPHEKLRQAVAQAMRAFEAGGAEAQLIESVVAARKALTPLTAPGTLDILARLDQTPWCMAAKGCGAMGADIVLVLHARTSEGAVETWARDQRLEICGRLADLSDGLMSAPPQETGEA